MTNLYELGQAFNRTRRAKKIRQEAVAEAAGVSRRTVSRFIHGEADDVGLTKVLRMLECVGMTLEVQPLPERPTFRDLQAHMQSSPNDEPTPATEPTP